MLSYLLIALFFGIIGAIYWGIWFGQDKNYLTSSLRRFLQKI